MAVNKILIKVDGTQTDAIDFNSAISGLSEGSHTLTVEAYNGNSLVHSQTRNVVVPAIVEPNTPPQTGADSYTMDEDTTLTVNAANGVLSNDTDADGDNLIADLVSSTSNGSLTLNSDGSFTYTPDEDYYGSDSFVYRAYDGEDYSSNRTVDITINDVTDGGTSYEAETTDFMTATSTPDDTSASIYTGMTNHDCWVLLDNVIKYYKAEGVWEDIIHWHPMFGGTAPKHSLNVKDVSSFQMTFNGSWGHSAAGNDAAAYNCYASWGFIAANEMEFENSGMSVVSLSSSTSEGTPILMGAISDSGKRAYLQVDNDDVYVRLGSTSTGQVDNDGDAKGIFSGTRSDGTVKVYIDGAEVHSGGGGGTGLPTVESFYGACNNDGIFTYRTDKILGSAMHHKSTDLDAIQEGLRMWEEGLGRL